MNSRRWDCDITSKLLRRHMCVHPRKPAGVDLRPSIPWWTPLEQARDLWRRRVVRVEDLEGVPPPPLGHELVVTPVEVLGIRREAKLVL